MVIFEDSTNKILFYFILFLKKGICDRMFFQSSFCQMEKFTTEKIIVHKNNFSQSWDNGFKSMG
jgi:hypothetical protein